MTLVSSLLIAVAVVLSVVKLTVMVLGLCGKFEDREKKEKGDEDDG